MAQKRSEGNVGASDRRERELRQGTEGRMGARVQTVVCARWRAKSTILGLKTGQRRDVRGNVATLQRGLKPTSRNSGQRCNVTESGTKRRRDVGYQRRDVTEAHKNSRRDVDYSCRDVPESIQIDVATFQKVYKLTSRRCKSTSRRSREYKN